MACNFSAITQFQISNHEENTLNIILELTNYHTKHHFEKQSAFTKSKHESDKSLLTVSSWFANRHKDLTTVSMLFYILPTLFLVIKHW